MELRLSFNGFSDRALRFLRTRGRLSSMIFQESVMEEEPVNDNGAEVSSLDITTGILYESPVNPLKATRKPQKSKHS